MNATDYHCFRTVEDGDRPGESRLVCTCGWRSVSAPGDTLDFDVHVAEINGISLAAQKKRTAAAMRALR